MITAMECAQQGLSGFGFGILTGVAVFVVANAWLRWLFSE